MPRLAVLRAPGAGRQAREAWVRQEGVLGRRQGDPSHTVTVWTEQEEVPLDLSDALVSRRHARLFFEGARLFLQDLGSRNGTFLNGQRLPSPGPGRRGDPLPVTQGQAQVGLGSRCVVEVVLLDSALGLAPREWNRVSASLSSPDFKVLRDTVGWGKRLQAAPADPLQLAQFREWFNSNQRQFDLMLEVMRGQMDEMREDYRLALQAHLSASDKGMDTALKVVLALTGGSPAA